MLRKLLIAVLLLIAALVVVTDRVGAKVAGHVLAGKLQTDENLPTRPSVSSMKIAYSSIASTKSRKRVSLSHNACSVARCALKSTTCKNK